MPVYVAKCNHCKRRTEVFRTVAEYDQMPECCGVMMQKVITPLYVVEDMKPYVSPLDKTVISSRKQHRDHMIKHDVIEVGNERITPKKKKIAGVGLKEDLIKAFYG